jgi:molecular chaperone GrpE
LSALLPIVDDFDRGISEISKTEEDSNLLQGMQLIYDKFTKTLDQKGLVAMDVKQGEEFDADRHEAVTQIPAPSPELKGKIIDVIEKGYELGEKIIRYPKVVIGQ